MSVPKKHYTSKIYIIMGKIAIIALIVLLLFGAKKIPELFKGLGQGIKEFKDETKDIHLDDDKK